MSNAFLGTEELYGEVGERIEDMAEYLEPDSLRRQTNTVVRLTRVTAFGLIATTVTGYVGMNVFGHHPLDHLGTPARLLTFCVVMVAVTWLAIYTVMTSKGLSGFLDLLSNERETGSRKAGAALASSSRLVRRPASRHTLARSTAVSKMVQSDTRSRFTSKLLRPATPGNDTSWAFVILPKRASSKLPRRGRTTVAGTINGHRFRATLEPDGQLSHWLRINKELLGVTGASVGDLVAFEIVSVEQEPEPEIPSDLRDALAAAPEARAVWDDTTTIARVDWVHWITSAKQARTRAKRIGDACDKLASGKRRVCCFDPSGYYSKAFSAPEAAN